ncbi:MAG: fumarylacetoacetate hydrolase family protein [Pseudomonadota bacterium]
MTFIFEPARQVTLPVTGTDARFPVNNIYCVGRNYADHAIEMGHDPNREAPFFFLKPSYCVLPSGGEMVYPAHSEDVHHEVELVVALKSGDQDIAVQAAMNHVFGYGVGIDMTRRDLQAEAKSLGRPWEAGKVFLHAAPCSDLTAIEQTGPLEHGEISLSINDQEKQSGNLSQMIWKVPEIISRLSSLFSLAPGDLIFTGTPAGVGPVARGDSILAKVAGLTELRIGIS